MTALVPALPDRRTSIEELDRGNTHLRGNASALRGNISLLRGSVLRLRGNT